MPKSVLTIEDCKNVWSLRKLGYKYKEIAEMYGVSVQCIQQGIERRRTQYAILTHIFS